MKYTFHLNTYIMSISFKKLSNNAYIPTKATNLSAGYDLYSPQTVEIPIGMSKPISTELQIFFPHDHCYGRIAARSGMSLRNYVTALDGVVNTSNDKNFSIILYNFGEKPYIVEKGDRIAQIICEKTYFRSMRLNVYFKQLSKEAFIPVKTANATFQLYSPSNFIILEKTVMNIEMCLETMIPGGHYGRITNANCNNNTMVLETIVMSKNKIIVKLYNFSNIKYKIKRGENIAQIIFEKIIRPSVSSSSPLRFEKRTPKAISPTETLIGFELYSPIKVTIPSKKVILLYTDLNVHLPYDDQCYGRIATLDNNNNTFMALGGVIDKDYEGNIGVIVYNYSKMDRVIEKNEKIAHFICESIIYPTNNSNSNSSRGSNGFGSSGY